MRSRVPLSEQIHAWLRNAILDVDLIPGAPIVESEVAARFGSSRTPVREALLRLADEALVEIRPQRGTSVARLVLNRIEEAQFIRQAVEGAVIRRICAQGTHFALADELARLLRGHAVLVRSNDTSAAFDADTIFHRTLVEAGGLPGVWEVVARAREMHQRVRSIAVPELRTAGRALAEHRKVVKALRTGDADAAAGAMAAHLSRNLVLARELAERHPDYFEASPARSLAGPAYPSSFVT